jgi:hypothetical protein
MRVSVSKIEPNHHTQSHTTEFEVDQEWSVKQLLAWGATGRESFSEQLVLEQGGTSFTPQQWIKWAGKSKRRQLWYHEQRFYMQVVFAMTHLPFCNVNA